MSFHFFTLWGLLVSVLRVRKWFLQFGDTICDVGVNRSDGVLIELIRGTQISTGLSSWYYTGSHIGWESGPATSAITNSLRRTQLGWVRDVEICNRLTLKVDWIIRSGLAAVVVAVAGFRMIRQRVEREAIERDRDRGYL